MTTLDAAPPVLLLAGFDAPPVALALVAAADEGAAVVGATGVGMGTGVPATSSATIGDVAFCAFWYHA